MNFATTPRKRTKTTSQTAGKTTEARRWTASGSSSKASDDTTRKRAKTPRQRAIRQVRLGSWKKKKHFKDTIERRKIVQEKIGTFQHLDANESMVGEKCLNDLEVGTKMTRLGCYIDQWCPTWRNVFKKNKTSRTVTKYLLNTIAPFFNTGE